MTEQEKSKQEIAGELKKLISISPRRMLQSKEEMKAAALSIVDEMFNKWDMNDHAIED